MTREILNELAKAKKINLDHFDKVKATINNVWHFDRLSSADKIKEGIAHATPKPIPLCGLAIKTSSREGEIVLDVFGGSGSTLMNSSTANVARWS